MIFGDGEQELLETLRPTEKRKPTPVQPPPIRTASVGSRRSARRTSNINFNESALTRKFKYRVPVSGPSPSEIQEAFGAATIVNRPNKRLKTPNVSGVVSMATGQAHPGIPGPSSTSSEERDEEFGDASVTVRPLRGGQVKRKRATDSSERTVKQVQEGGGDKSHKEGEEDSGDSTNMTEGGVENKEDDEDEDTDAENRRLLLKKKKKKKKRKEKEKRRKKREKKKKKKMREDEEGVENGCGSDGDGNKDGGGSGGGNIGDGNGGGEGGDDCNGGGDTKTGGGKGDSNNKGGDDNGGGGAGGDGNGIGGVEAADGAVSESEGKLDSVELDTDTALVVEEDGVVSMSEYEIRRRATLERNRAEMVRFGILDHGLMDDPASVPRQPRTPYVKGKAPSRKQSARSVKMTDAEKQSIDDALLAAATDYAISVARSKAEDHNSKAEDDRTSDSPAAPPKLEVSSKLLEQVHRMIKVNRKKFSEDMTPQTLPPRLGLRAFNETHTEAPHDVWASSSNLPVTPPKKKKERVP